MISVIGNIASGKSTLLKNLSRRGFEVLQEPVSDWKFLSKFYEDPKRWCFALQIEILHSFSSMHTDGKIVERSPYEANKIFAYNSYRNGCLTSQEYDLIDQISQTHRIPDQFIYMRCPPEVCMDRLQQRNRDCESEVTISYLKDLHDLYETFVQKLERDGQKVHRIDGCMTEQDILRDTLFIPLCSAHSSDQDC